MLEGLPEVVNVQIPQWYILYLRPQLRQKAIRQLKALGIEYYFPYNMVGVKRGCREKLHFEPLFQSYLFVFIAANSLKVLKDISGVVSFIYWLHRPALVRQEEIDVIRYFVEHYINICLKKSEVNTDAIPEININFPPRSKRTIIINNDLPIAIAYLPSLGFQMTAETPNIDQAKILLKAMPRDILPSN